MYFKVQAEHLLKQQLTKNCTTGDFIKQNMSQHFLNKNNKDGFSGRTLQ